MHTGPSSSPHASGLQSFLQPKGHTATSALTRVNAETRAQADISIMTAEGDKVTLSANSVLQAAYASYDARGRMHGQQREVHADAWQLAATHNTAIRVEGDLNDEELADIQHLLENLGTMVTDFLAGDLDEAVMPGLNLGELGTLVGFDASFEYIQQTRVEQQYTAQGSLRDTPASAKTPAESTLISPKSIARLLDRMLRAVEDSSVEPKTLLAELPKFTDTLRKNMLHQQGVDTPKTKLTELLMSQFEQHLDAEISAEQA
jgi:hypothetical protein